MNTKVLLLLAMACCALSQAYAQGIAAKQAVATDDPPSPECRRDPNSLECFATKFPTISDLSQEWDANYKNAAHLAPKSWTPGTSGSAELGSAGPLRGLLFDNITLKADYSYSRVVSSELKDGTLPPLALSKVTFQPTYSATYTVTPSKFFDAWHQLWAPKTVESVRNVQRDLKRAELLKSYADFQQARFEFQAAAKKFREKSQKNGAALDEDAAAGKAFFAMKSKAIALLSLVGRAQNPDKMEAWLAAEYSLSSETKQATASETKPVRAN